MYYNDFIRSYKVYCLLNPLKSGQYTYEDLIFEFEPFYVGLTKNIEYRFREHVERTDGESRNDLKDEIITNLGSDGEVPLIFILLITLNLDEAQKMEYDLIKKIGRICDNSGPLVNKLLGSISKNKKWTEEQRKEQSIRIKVINRNNPNLAIEHGKKIKEVYKNDPNIIGQISKKVSQLWNDKDYRDRQSRSHKEAFLKNPKLKESCVHNRKTWIVIDSNNKEYKVENLREFCKDNGLVYVSFIPYQDKDKSYKGWKLKNYKKGES